MQEQYNIYYIITSITTSSSPPAIHRAAGPALLQACCAIPEVTPGIRCPTGQARITAAGNLPVRYVIHTVGPVYQDPQHSAPLLASAYTSSLTLANQHGCKTVAFPAISCGVFGYVDGWPSVAVLTNVHLTTTYADCVHVS